MDESQLLLVHALVLQYIGVFLDPEYTEAKRHQRLLEMKPREGDFERVFLPSMIGQARALYGAMWSNPPPLRAKPGQTRMWVRIAITEDFVEWNRRGQEFPGGYRKLAPHLQRGVIWGAWKFVA